MNCLKFVFYLLLPLSLSSCRCETGDSCDNPPLKDLYPCSRTNLSAIRSAVSTNAVFNNTQLIPIPPYTFPATNEQIPVFGNTINVLGDNSLQNILNISSDDCCDYAPLFDIYPQEPVFKWETISSNLVAVAVFKNVIKLSLDSKRIQNINDIVWTWNTGMGIGTQISGNTIVEYKDGKDVKEGKTALTTTPLEKNGSYFWAVWAWDENGINIKHSSRAIPFIVESLPVLPVLAFDQLVGNWKLEFAINELTGNDFTNDFPIRSFKGESLCEGLRYTLSTGEQGIINNDNDTNEYLVENIILAELALTCDDTFIGKANYNGVIYRVSFSK